MMKFRVLSACLMLCFSGMNLTTSGKADAQQTDTNLIATGDWSEAVSDSPWPALRGRLLVYDERGPARATTPECILSYSMSFREFWRTRLKSISNSAAGTTCTLKCVTSLTDPFPRNQFSQVRRCLIRTGLLCLANQPCGCVWISLRSFNLSPKVWQYWSLAGAGSYRQTRRTTSFCRPHSLPRRTIPVPSIITSGKER